MSQTLRTLKGHTNSVNAVAVTADRRRAVSASADQTLRLWDLANGQTIHTFEGHADWVKAAVVTPDGHGAVSASYDKTLSLWYLESGQTLHSFEGHTDWINAVAVTADSRRANKSCKQPATLRFTVFTCGAVLGRSRASGAAWSSQAVYDIAAKSRVVYDLPAIDGCCGG
jgi:WD40 repeat protein